MKVALVHDYLIEYGGAERVLEVLHELFPKAPLYVAYFDPKGLGFHAGKFTNWEIKTSWMQKFPRKLISPFRIFAPATFEAFDLSDYDLVISSCAIYFSKAVITKPGSLHISYIHTPPRYLYGYTTSFNYKKNPVTRVLGELANHFLRIWDFETSQRPDILVANSKNVQERIKKFYRRDSVVIYPPVELSDKKRKSDDRRLKTEDYFLTVGRLVRGKGTEVIVEAATRLGILLKIAGTGPEMESLRKIAGKNVQFLGWVSDTERVKLLQNARALIVASEDEDFGIVPVESMAAGTPVIAPKAGGFLETVVDGRTGRLYGGNNGQVTVDSLVDVLKGFNHDDYKEEDSRKQAEKFGKVRFKKEILELIEKNLRALTN